jgi:hypothetical protein
VAAAVQQLRGGSDGWVAGAAYSLSGRGTQNPARQNSQASQTASEKGNSVSRQVRYAVKESNAATTREVVAWRWLHDNFRETAVAELAEGLAGTGSTPGRSNSSQNELNQSGFGVL